MVWSRLNEISTDLHDLRGNVLEPLRNDALYKSTYFTFYFNVT